MIITNGQLRPPSPKEMAARRVPLDRIALSWTISTDDSCPTPDAYPCGCPETEGYVYSNGTATLTTGELIEFHKDYAIPYEAHVVVDEFEDFILDWSHLTQCQVCGSWYENDGDHQLDPLHASILKSRAKAREHAAKARNAEEGWDSDDNDDD